LCAKRASKPLLFCKALEGWHRHQAKKGKHWFVAEGNGGGGYLFLALQVLYEIPVAHSPKAKGRKHILYPWV